MNTMMTDTIENVTETDTPHEGIAPEAPKEGSSPTTKARKARKPVSESVAADKAKAREEAKAKREEERAAKAKEKEAAKQAKARKPVKAPKAHKPESATIDGFEIKGDADPYFINDATLEIHDTLVTLITKDSETLSGYLKVGEYLSKVAPLFKSTKVYGAFIGKHAPELLKIDTAMRSNSKWLFENQNEVMRVLGVNNLLDRSGNPTVLRQMYRKALAEQEAAEEGMTAEEKAAKEKEERKASKEGMEEAITFGLNAFLAEIDKLPHKSAVKRAKDFAFGVLTVTKREEVAAFVSSMYPMPLNKEEQEVFGETGEVIEE